MADLTERKCRGWIDNVRDHFRSFAAGSFFRDNPVLALCRIAGYDPQCYQVVRSAFTDASAQWHFNQLVHFHLADGCTYRQIVHDAVMLDGPEYYRVLTVPFWATLLEARRELQVVRRNEARILQERFIAMNPLPTWEFTNRYLSLDVAQGTLDATVDSALCLRQRADGREVETLAATYERILQESRLDVTNSWIARTTAWSRIMAINSVVNRYWITHMLAGRHSDYKSYEELSRSVQSCLSGYPGIFRTAGVAINPVVYRVVISPLEGIKKDLCFVNSAVRQMCSAGSQQKSPGRAYPWKVHQVSVDGHGFMLDGRMMELIDDQATKWRVLGRVRDVIQYLEGKLPFVAEASNGAIPVPLIVIAPSGNTSPTGDLRSYVDVSSCGRDVHTTSHTVEDICVQIK